MAATVRKLTDIAPVPKSERSKPNPEWKRFIKAQLSSSMASATDWVVVAVLITLHIHYLIAAPVGALAGAVVDFSLKKWWVFEAHGAGLRRQAVRYAMVSGASAGWNAALAYVCVDLAHLPPIPGVIAASIIVGFAWNYPMQRSFVFRAQRLSRTSA